MYLLYVPVMLACYGWSAYVLSQRDFTDHADLIVCGVFAILFAVLWPLTLAAVSIHLFGDHRER